MVLNTACLPETYARPVARYLPRRSLRLVYWRPFFILKSLKSYNKNVFQPICYNFFYAGV